MQKGKLALLCCAVPLMISSADAQDSTNYRAAAPAGVLALDAQASSEVPQDVIHITLFYEEQAADAARLSDALNQRTAQALRDAHGAHRDEVSIQTGQLSISPTNDKDGKISGWCWNRMISRRPRDWPRSSMATCRWPT
jgi:predicted secreted protein